MSVKDEFKAAWKNDDIESLKRLVLEHDPENKQAYKDAWKANNLEAYKQLVLSIPSVTASDNVGPALPTAEDKLTNLAPVPETVRESTQTSTRVPGMGEKVESKTPARSLHQPNAKVIEWIKTAPGFQKVRDKYGEQGMERFYTALAGVEDDLVSPDGEVSREITQYPGQFNKALEGILGLYYKTYAREQKAGARQERKDAGASTLDELGRVIFPNAADAEGVVSTAATGAVDLMEAIPRVGIAGVKALGGGNFMDEATAPDELRSGGEKLATSMMSVGSLVKAPAKLAAKGAKAGLRLSTKGRRTVKALEDTWANIKGKQATTFYSAPDTPKDMAKFSKIFENENKLKVFGKKAWNQMAEDLAENGVVDAAYLLRDLSDEDKSSGDALTTFLGVLIGGAITGAASGAIKPSGLKSMSHELADNVSEYKSRLKAIGFSDDYLEELADKLRNGEINFDPDAILEDVKKQANRTMLSKELVLSAAEGLPTMPKDAREALSNKQLPDYDLGTFDPKVETKPYGTKLANVRMKDKTGRTVGEEVQLSSPIEKPGLDLTVDKNELRQKAYDKVMDKLNSVDPLVWGRASNIGPLAKKLPSPVTGKLKALTQSSESLDKLLERVASADMDWRKVDLRKDLKRTLSNEARDFVKQVKEVRSLISSRREQSFDKVVAGLSKEERDIAESIKDQLDLQEGLGKEVELYQTFTTANHALSKAIDQLDKVVDTKAATKLISEINKLAKEARESRITLLSHLKSLGLPTGTQVLKAGGGGAKAGVSIAPRAYGRTSETPASEEEQ